MNMVPTFSGMLVAVGLPVLLALAGTALLLVGWRGRRVGDHPTCRRCGFDLIGMPAGVGVCSECGADVTRPKAVRTGHLRRRRGLLWAGAAWLLVGGGSLATTGYVSARNANLNPFKPFWVLSWETGRADVQTRDAALAEITARIAAGGLDDAQGATLVDRALALQADRGKAWVPAWGDLIEAARQKGKVSDEQWRRYARQGPTLGIAVRPVVRRGDPLLPYWVICGPARLGTSSKMSLGYDSRNVSVRLTGIELPNGQDGGFASTSGMGPTGTTRTGGALHLPSQVVDRLKDGPQTLRLLGKFEVVDLAGGPGTPAVTVDADLKADWRLNPADQPTVTVKHDPSLRPAVEGALSVERLELRPGVGGNGARFSVTVAANGLPVGVGYRMVARSGERQWPIGKLAYPAGAVNHSFSTDGDAEGFDAERADILFTPDAQAASSTPNVFEIWDGEVLFKDVPVTRTGNTPRGIGK